MTRQVDEDRERLRDEAARAVIARERRRLADRRRATWLAVLLVAALAGAGLYWLAIKRAEADARAHFMREGL